MVTLAGYIKTTSITTGKMPVFFIEKIPNHFLSSTQIQKAVVIKMILHMDFAKITFYYRNKPEKPVEVTIPIKDLKQHIHRMIEHNGILLLQGKKIDLILVEKIIIEYTSDLAVV